ncbi:MAG TPA: thiamine phosphate synthase [Polyangiales bacterium]
MKGLYAIIDPDHCAGRDPRWVGEQVLEGGCAALQLRAKSGSDRAQLALARALAQRCREKGVPFWINDRLDLGLLVEADGVHLGQDDIPLEEARRIYRGLLGTSTHDLAQARAAVEAGADVIGFGPVFPTHSKRNPDPVVGVRGLAEVCMAVKVPVIAIGGIDLAHARDVVISGASYAAAIGALCMADDPQHAARELHHALR